MKVLFCSDIHGNSEAFLKVVNFFKFEEIDKMIILGDLFSSSYGITQSDKDISDMLWDIKDKLIIVEGNCDSSLYPSYDLSPVGYIKKYNININNHDAFCYHGHILYENNTSKFIVQGHTHISKISIENNQYYLNPGSVGRPRDNIIGSFMIISKEVITIFDINGTIIEEKIII